MRLALALALLAAPAFTWAKAVAEEISRHGEAA
jgi:hypothetical protein